MQWVMPSAGWRTRRIHSSRGANPENRGGQNCKCSRTIEALSSSWRTKLGDCILFKFPELERTCVESQCLMKSLLIITLRAPLWLQRDGAQKKFHLWQICVFPFLLGSKNSCFSKLLFINNLLLINYLFLISSKIKEITSRQKSVYLPIYL